MSELKVGDLAYVARPMACCGATTGQGIMFTVFGFWISPIEELLTCQHCGKEIPTGTLFVTWNKGETAIEAYRVKKIEPPSDNVKYTDRKELETT